MEPLSAHWQDSKVCLVFWWSSSLKSSCQKNSDTHKAIQMCICFWFLISIMGWWFRSWGLDLACLVQGSVVITSWPPGVKQMAQGLCPHGAYCHLVEDKGTVQQNVKYSVKIPFCFSFHKWIFYSRIYCQYLSINVVQTEIGRSLCLQRPLLAIDQVSDG